MSRTCKKWDSIIAVHVFWCIIIFGNMVALYKGAKGSVFSLNINEYFSFLFLSFLSKFYTCSGGFGLFSEYLQKIISLTTDFSEDLMDLKWLDMGDGSILNEQKLIFRGQYIFYYYPNQKGNICFKTSVSMNTLFTFHIRH